jgi:phosphoglycolate phosphatase
MVGDRYNDVEGAHAVGIECAGVLFGYGDREEMEKCGADYIIEKALDLLNIV